MSGAIPPNNGHRRQPEWRGAAEWGSIMLVCGNGCGGVAGGAAALCVGRGVGDRYDLIILHGWV